MDTIAVIALLDRYDPPYVKLFWGPYDASIMVNNEDVVFSRDLLGDVRHILTARGYHLSSEDALPSEGMQIYSR